MSSSEEQEPAIPPTRKRYKRYTIFDSNDDEPPRIPRTTLWRHNRALPLGDEINNQAQPLGDEINNRAQPLEPDEINARPSAVTPPPCSSAPSCSNASHSPDLARYAFNLSDNSLVGDSPERVPPRGDSSEVDSPNDSSGEDPSDSSPDDLSGGDPSDNSPDDWPDPSEEPSVDNESSDPHDSSSQDSNESSDSRVENSDLPSSDSDAAGPENPFRRHEYINREYSLDDNIDFNSNLSKFEVLVLVFHFAMQFCLSSAGIEALLKLLNTILGSTLIPPNKYHFENLFCPAQITSFHLYCPNCLVYIGPKDTFNGRDCPECHAQVSTSTNEKATNFFLQLSLEQQIKTRLEKDGDHIINYRRQRPIQPDTISDVFDGVVFMDLKDHGLQDNDITITINTDGAAVFGSSKNSLWPLQVRINEIPPNRRFSAQNLIVAGLWFGRGEINLTSYMVPFIEELKSLAINGISWFSNALNSMVNTKVYVSHCVLDAPAKCKVLNMIQFNGRDSCFVCHHPGNIIDNNQIRFSDEVQYADRTNEGMRRDMLTAHESGVVTNGFKDASPLSALPYLMFPLVITIDYMHSHLLGVVRYLWTNLWTFSPLHAEPYYLSPAQIKLIDRRIHNLFPPSEISRDPRSITLSTFWKANEWRSWVFFYAPVCLQGILPAPFYNHFCLLSCALFLLNQKQIQRGDIVMIQNYLDEFVERFERLYGLRYMTYNVHNTKHLAKCVIYSGPLWSHSAFPYESGNGYLITLVKGAMGVPQQIARKYATWVNLPKLLSLHPPLKEEVLQYCNSIVPFSRFKNFDLCENVVIQGHKFRHKFNPLPTVEQQMREKNLDVANVFKVSQIIFSGAKYSIKSKPRNNSVIKLQDGRYAVILNFILCETHPDDLYVVIKEILVHGKLHNIFQSQVNVCQRYAFGNLSIVSVNEISEKCVLISQDRSQYIIEFPNKFEKD